MRDRLITALVLRVAQFREHGDADVLFDTVAAAEARELRELVIRRDGRAGSVSLTALDALAEFHMARHQARPSGGGHADYGQALRLLFLRAQVHPEGVSEAFVDAVNAAHEQAYKAGEKARRLLEEGRRTRDPGTLDRAVHHFRGALELLVTGDDVPGLPMAHLSGALMQRFLVKGDAADLDEAIEVREASIAYTDKDNPELARRLAMLSMLLGMRYDRSGKPPDLERAVTVGREAVRATPTGHHARARRLAHLAKALHSRYERTNTLTDLREAVGYAQEAVETAQPDDPDRLDQVAALAQCRRELYDRLHDPADLDEPVELLESLLATASEAARPQAQTELATALYYRHERMGDLADLERVIDLERQALAATSEADPARGRRLANLAASHRVRHDRLGAPEDLAEAIRVGTEAVSASEDDGFSLSHLGLAFMYRYRRTLEAADLDRAIRLATRAVEAYPEVSPSTHRALAMMHLAEALGARLRRDFDPLVLDEVIRWQRKAAATVPRSHPDVGRYLCALSQMLLRRFHLTESPEDLAEAIRTAEDAVAVTPRSHPSYPQLACCLAEALTSGPQPAPDALDRAVDLARDAVSAVHSDDVVLPRAWRRLGHILNRRHDFRRDPDDLREAIRCWRRAADLPTATPEERMGCCGAWGSAAVELGDHTLAAEGFGRAALLLPQLAWHGLPTAARANHLAEWSGLAPLAATCHILAGAPERAVEILEQGRTVIQNQSLHLRGDLSHLAEREPTLAAALMRVREQLDAQGFATGADPAEMLGESLLSPLGRERLARARAALCREWDELVAEVRRLDGFAYFLAPVPYEELRAAAGQGSVVVVNVSELACHALVVRDAAAPVEVVDLSGVSHAEVARQAQAFVSVLLARREPHRPFLRREADRHAVHDVLEWLWERIAEPVLERLDLLGEGREPLPRLWWCPSGLLTLLPLHAAGRYPRHRAASDSERPPGSCVPGWVVSSYTSTLTALLRARERDRDAGFGGLLAVAMPETPGRPALPGVRREYEELRAAFPEGCAVGALFGPEATREAVRRSLHDSSWVHFACHAEQDLMDPAQSALALYDARLTVAELLELDLPHAELAYLSACETAAGAVRLPDEVMHLASTMQLTGYRHVIATMWGIHDGSAPDMAAQVYAELTRPGFPDATRAARALHTAVAAQRAHDPTDPLRWAAYLHVGP